jgi:methylmalonyl-CoA mutase
MGDIQEYFVHHKVRNFYSVSISGYHIAEAGANPISQLAFTLSNGFTFVEYYLARGMHIDDFAPNLSFFFSNGMDPEYTVIGRVARRIWARRDARALRRQRAQPEAQVPHPDVGPLAARAGDPVQRHPHHAAGADRDLRQLQLAAHQRLRRGDHHADRGSVRRAMAIQLIINREWGLAKNENPNQGSFIIDELTDLVEEAVLQGVRGDLRARRRARRDGDRLPARQDPGRVAVLRAQEARRLAADHRRQHLPQSARRGPAAEDRAARSTDEEKQSQLKRLRDFHARTPGRAPAMLKRLQQAVIDNGNVFAVLMDAVRVCSLGQITHALFEVGGQYRRIALLPRPLLISIGVPTKPNSSRSRRSMKRS